MSWEGWCEPFEALSEMYYGDADLRGLLFAGFCSLSGFLFSVQAFVLPLLKSTLYDTRRYRKRAELMAIRHDKVLDIYLPLRQLSGVLTTVVVLSTVTTLSQITIGFIEHPSAAAFCYAIAVVTLLTFLYALWLATREFNYSLSEEEE